MKRAWRILLIAGACVAVAIGVALLWAREREPEYKGRKLSEWIQDGRDPKLQPADRAAKIEAIRQIGTNSLPYLLKWIEAGESPKTYNKADIVVIRVMNRGTARRWLNYRQRKFYRAAEASWAFEVLGTNGISAVPELIRLSHSTNSMVADFASDALSRIKTNATPALAGYTKDPTAPAWAHWTNDAGKLQPPTTNSH